MEKKIVTFKGISNVPDDGFNEAGDMAVLMNMRHKGGELVPCGEPTPVAVGEELKQVLYHANSGYWLGLNSRGDLYSYDDNMNPCGDEIAEGVESFALMGNIVIINFADRVEYAIWRNGDFEYLGGLPEVPRMKIETTRRPVKVSTAPNKYYKNLSTAITNGNNAELWNSYVKKGYLDKCLDALYMSAAFVDLANFRLAIKLFDGTYMSLSPIYVVNGTHDTTSNYDPAGGLKNFRWTYPMGASEESVEYTAAIEGFIPQFTLEEYDFSKWTDIISSICLFTTGSLPLRGVGEGLKYYNKDSIISRSYEDYILLTPEEIKKQYFKAGYYKLAEFDLKGKLVYSLDNTSPSNLAVQDVLSVANIHQNKAENALVINSRLHVNNIETLFFPGFNDVTAFGEGAYWKNVKKIVVKTYIKTQDGDITVLTKKEDSEMNVSALLTYPDARAYKMDVYIQGAIGNQYTLYYKSFDLAKDESGACAYYIDSKAWNLHQVTVESDLTYSVSVVNENGLLDYARGLNELSFTYNEGGYWSCYNYGRVDALLFFNIKGNPSKGDNFKVKINSNNPETVISLTSGFNSTMGSMPEKVLDATLVWENSSLKDFTVDNKTIKEVRKNTLKVSAVDNPFYFPTAQTYKFEGEIKGLASNAEAISTGQFGQYPLFVFTDTGIWAMGVDTSGQGAYTTQSPFSREVCNGAICPVSGGVVFTTKRGVMAISGGQVTELSKPLDGLEEMLFNFSGALAGQIFARAGYGGYEKFEPVPIREYIKGESGNVKGESGAKLAYNYLHNEVILSNPAEKYKYSYVYNLDSQTWGMIDTKFDITTNSYPELVVYNNGEGKMYIFDDTTTGVVPVVAITRPFTMGSLDFKRIRQAGLRTTFEGQLNFYVLGSIDGANFVCITGKEYPSKNGNESTDVTRRDLITAMSRSKQYKYFVIAVAGDIEGRISMAELLVDMGFANNQIR